MADDGLVVNFEVPASFSRTAPAVHGGRWTDRVKAKKTTQRRIQKQAQAIASSDFNIAPTTVAAKPERRSGASGGSGGGAGGGQGGRRTEVVDRYSANSSLKRKRGDGDAGPSKHQGVPGKQQGAAGQHNDFVSSLWTQNPESKPDEPEQVVEAEAQAPSNAPLSGESETFVSLGVSPILANHITTKLALKAPTAIQKAAIPKLIVEDSDAFIQAETGSGKTLTYLLPIVDRLMRLHEKDSETAGNRQEGLFAIILAPTRELSRQIMSVLQTLIHCKNGPHWIVPGHVIGGEKKKSEKARIRKGVNILVATPGRLLDHLETTTALNVSQVRWLVLDEGDRLMELGFEESLTKILDLLEVKRNKGMALKGQEPLPKRRVTMLCSATMKTNVQKLGEKSLKDALYIKAAPGEKEEGMEEDENDENKFSAPAQLKQSYVVVPAKLRLVGLNAVLQRAFIRQTANPKVIVFFSCSDSVDFHFSAFSRGAEEPEKKPDKRSIKKPMSGAHSESSKEDKKEEKKHQPPNPAVSSAPLLHPKLLLHKLHGSLEQRIRTATLTSFAQSKTPSVLFCTDVAARGLDLPNVDLIIQFDPPFTPDDHLHRIGRTARAGRDGRAVMFLLPGPEEGYVDAVLKKGIREGQLSRSSLDDAIKKGYSGHDKEKQRDWEDRATEWQLDVERWVMADKGTAQLAAKAWGSHIRAYTTHPSGEKGIFNHKALHYGHMAKAFGLREKPGDIKVPGTNAGPAKVRQPGEGKKRKLDKDDIAEAAGEEAVKRMKLMARKMERKGAGLANEFNIG